MPGLFRKIRGLLGSSSVQNGKSKTHGPIQILEESYRDLCSLSRQLCSHAERAPYPHVARRLRQMAEEARSSANFLRDKILSTGKRIEEISGDVKSGKNHWERMVQDLSDEKEIETRFLERAALMDEAAPEAAELLRQIAVSHRPHIDALLDLIARADPQAEQT